MPPERSSRQKVRPLHSNIKQVTKVWARIHHAIHTKRPFTLFSFILSDPQILANRTIIHQKLVIWQKKLSHYTKTLLLPSLEKAKSLISQTKSCHECPQNSPSDKLDPKEFKRTRRWTRKKIGTNNGDNLYPNWNSREKLRTICQLGKYEAKKSQNRISFEL